MFLETTERSADDAEISNGIENERQPRSSRMASVIMKLTGPQQITMDDARNGLIYRGKHNDVCHELRRLGLVKYEPQPGEGGQHHEQPAWRVTGASIKSGNR